MIVPCPQCGQQIPATLQNCQFCGAIVSPAIRSAARSKSGEDELEAGSGIAAAKVWKIYNGLAIFWVVSAGLSIILSAILASLNPDKAANYLGIDLIFNLVTVLIGLGLIFRYELARKAATFFCILSIIRGFLLVVGGMLSLLYAGLFGIPFLIIYIINILLAAAMIWAISETERIMAFDRYDQIRGRR